MLLNNFVIACPSSVVAIPLGSTGKGAESTPGSLSAAAALGDFRVATGILKVVEKIQY